MNIQLPEQVYEERLYSFLLILNQDNSDSEVIVDFENVRYYIPAAIVALITKFYQWSAEGRSVRIINHSRCSAYKYLQRIDFFKNCGLDLQETFYRHNSLGRFVPIKKIGNGCHNVIDTISTEVATCLVPEMAELFEPDETGFFDCIQYCVSELGSNVIQHSRGIGFISAQYAEQSDYARISIADNGIGIRESFRFNSSPYWHDQMSDFDAIKKALEPEVSCKSHLRSGWFSNENAGVGLSLISSIASRLQGNFIIASGSCFYSPHSVFYFPSGQEYNGTLCSFLMRRSCIKNFANVLFESKSTLGLIKNIDQFQSMFE
jgi:hypothetical protein